MKILFINLSHRPDSNIRVFPVGLGYILSAVNRSGIDFDFFDMDINQISLQELDKLLNEKKYDIYAFGAIVTSFKTVKEIAQIIRKNNPAATIIAGNSVASAIPEILMEHTEVDIGVKGEGDYIIVDLLNALIKQNELKNVHGIFYKENGSVIHTPKRSLEDNIDLFGFPDWELFDINKYHNFNGLLQNGGRKWMPLNTGRGCPYRCTFCYITVRDDKKRYRRNSDKAIFDELNRLHYKYGANHIAFWDDLTFPNKRSVEAMVDTITGLDFKITWNAPIRGDLFDSKDVSLLKNVQASGCLELGFSLENADETILAAIDKHLELSQFVEQSRILNEVGITPSTSIIFGYPQETPDSIQKTLNVCEAAGIYPNVGYLMALPGTPIYEQLKQDGYFPNEYEYLMSIGDRQDFNMNFTTMPDDVFTNEVNKRLQNLAKKLGIKFDNHLKQT